MIPKNSPVIIHTTYVEARVDSPLNSTNNIKQVSKVNIPLSSGVASVSSKTTSQNIDLKQLKAEKLSLDENLPEVITIKKTLIADAALANFPYTRDTGELKGAMAADWGKSLGSLKDIFHVADTRQETIGENGIVTQNGLTAYLFTNDMTKEVRLVFGGTTSGATAGDFTTRSISNFVTTAKQWLTNIKNTLSGTPSSYKEAAQLAKDIHVGLPEGYTISLSGHSKGGGESAYAAMMLAAKINKPVKSINFSSAQLGTQLKQNIIGELSDNGSSQEVVKNKFDVLSKNILHVKVKGDPVPNMHKLFGSISHLGKTLTLPNDNKSFGHLSEHIDFFSRVANWVDSETMKNHQLVNRFV